MVHCSLTKIGERFQSSSASDNISIVWPLSLGYLGKKALIQAHIIGLELGVSMTIGPTMLSNNIQVSLAWSATGKFRDPVIGPMSLPTCVFRSIFAARCFNFKVDVKKIQVLFQNTSRFFFSQQTGHPSKTYFVRNVSELKMIRTKFLFFNRRSSLSGCFDPLRCFPSNLFGQIFSAPGVAGSRRSGIE